MYAKTIHSVSFPLAWQWAVEFVRNSPEKLTFGGGKEVKHAVDSQCTIILDEHAVRDVLNHVVHPSDPFSTPDKIREYIKEYSNKYDASNFDYTYYSILKRGFEFSRKYDNEEHFKWDYGVPVIDQIEALRNGLQKQVDEQLSSNRNIAVLWNPVVHTYSTKAQPCWNEILVRWLPGNKAQIFSLYRSHDLFAAWGGNAIAQVDFLNREVVKPCGCEIVEWVEQNFSLHIYEHNLPEANAIKRLQVNPALQSLQDKYDRINSPTIFDSVLEKMERGEKII